MTDNANSYATVDGTDWATNISGVIGAEDLVEGQRWPD
jgi:hypothetical protein